MSADRATDSAPPGPGSEHPRALGPRAETSRGGTSGAPGSSVAGRLRVLLSLLVALGLCSCPAVCVSSLTGYPLLLPPLLPGQDRSAEVETAIRARYESALEDVEVRHVNDIRGASDYPLSHKYRRWGYRVEYELGGLPLTFRLKALRPEDISEGQEDNAMGSYFFGLFPSDFAMTETEFKSVLRAYEEGSGERYVARMESAGDFDRQLAGYSGWNQYLVYPRYDDLWEFGEGDPAAVAHVVLFDLETKQAKYLGRLSELR